MYYRYNGIEHVEELGLDMAPFRSYDPAIGRWMQVDPLDHRYPNFSPYHYVMDNPVIYVDPDGERTFYFAGLGYDPNSPQAYGRSMKIWSSFLGGNFHFLEGTTTPGGVLADASYVNLAGYRPWNKSSIQRNYAWREENAINYITDNLSSDPLGDDEFNLVGTSMGSVVAAQTAIMLLEKDKELFIDNLVLGGSPIAKKGPLWEKLQDLKKSGRIGNIIYESVQIAGDDITGCSGTSNGCIGEAKAMGDAGLDHPHRRAANSLLFGHAFAKHLLGDLGIEGEKTQRQVSSHTSYSSAQLNEMMLTGTPASQQ